MMESSLPAESTCCVVGAELVAAYGTGRLGGAAAWSVEAHLPECSSCRRVLSGKLDQVRLKENRAILMTRLALRPDLERAGRASRWASWIVERVAVRLGVRAHVWRLLSATPSLRWSWLAGVALVLGVAIGAAHLAGPTGGLAIAVDGRAGPSVGMLPFLIVVPLIPLAGVASAFHPRFDPTAGLAAAAPISGIWLFCVRSLAVTASALIPAMLAALFIPGRGWLPLLVVLPALGVSAAAVALATVVRPVTAAIIAGAGWISVTAWAGLAAGTPAVAYSGTAQAVSLAVVLVGGCLLAARRRSLDLGWK